MRVVEYANDPRSGIPLTVVGGPLGAGTPRLLHHVLRHADGPHAVAVVRDLDRLLEGGAGDGHAFRRVGPVVEWSNGCRAIESDDPTETLTILSRETPVIQHVLIEAHGVTDPRRLGGYAYLRGYRPDGMVTVIDADTAADLERQPGFDASIRPLLQAADIVALDTLDAAGRQVAVAQRAIAAWAPSARFVWCRDGGMAPPLLLGSSVTNGAESALDDAAAWRPDYIPSHADAPHATVPAEHCRLWRFTADEPTNARDFRAWAGHLPSSILRGAGEVALAEDPRHRHVFVLFGARWRLVRGAAWDRDPPRTSVTLVGAGLRDD